MNLGTAIKAKSLGLRGYFCVFLVLAPLPALAQEMAALDLSQLSIEQLSNLEVTSVSRQADALSKAPGAIYVITANDVHRSGADSLPEMLRLAPNLEVARSGTSTYGISARGFNQQDATANKLLVMIDGRIVYSPLFSGTFWDVQNVVPDDIDRIEVMSGPGGALWGANAVNGVINVITKSARDTQGTWISGKSGSLDQSLNLQHGGMIDENLSYRIYGSYNQRGASVTATGANSGDAANLLQGGFRADWAQDQDTITLQGDIYNGFQQNVPAFVIKNNTSGGNAEARWTRDFADKSQLQVQLYFDNAYRQLISGIRANVDTYDVDAQYGFALGNHNIVVGGGYRFISDSFLKGPSTVALIPAEKSRNLINGFIQDKITLNDKLNLTVGLKLEDNVYSGLEAMPDARLAWEVTDKDLLWASISRAVRRPTRFDKELFTPGIFAGGPDFDSEDLLAYQLGYRGQPFDNLSFSVSAFYNVYDNLRTVEASTSVTFPLIVLNGMEGNTYGVEAWGTLDATDWWRLSAGVNYISKNLSIKPGSRDIFGLGFPGNDPDYQLSLRSSMSLSEAVTFDWDMRYIPALPAPFIPAYVEANARLGFRLAKGLEFSIVGSNLFQDQHAEFLNPSIAARQIPRSISAGINWEF